MNKSKVKRITIPDEIVAEFEAMRTSSMGGRSLCPWTPEQDAILLKFYPLYHKQDIVTWWKNKYGFGSLNTIKKRYKELTK